MWTVKLKENELDEMKNRIFYNINVGEIRHETWIFSFFIYSERVHACHFNNVSPCLIPPFFASIQL